MQPRISKTNARRADYGGGEIAEEITGSTGGNLRELKEIKCQDKYRFSDDYSEELEIGIRVECDFTMNAVEAEVCVFEGSSSNLSKDEEYWENGKPCSPSEKKDSTYAYAVGFVPCEIGATFWGWAWGYASLYVGGVHYVFDTGGIHLGKRECEVGIGGGEEFIKWLEEAWAIA